MSSYSDYARNVGDLMTRKAGARADATATKGQIWGNTLGSIGQMVAGFPQQMRQAQQSRFQAQKQQQEQEAALAIKDLFKRHGGQITPEFIADLRTVDPQAAFEVEAKVMQADKAALEYRQLLQKGAIDEQTFIAKTIGATDPKNPDSWFVAVETLKRGGVDPKPFGASFNPAAHSWAKNFLGGSTAPGMVSVNTVQDGVAGTARVPENEAGFYPSPPQTPTEANRLWVKRGEQVLRVGENDIQPGDIPYQPSGADGTGPLVPVPGPGGRPVYGTREQALGQPVPQSPEAPPRPFNMVVQTPEGPMVVDVNNPNPTARPVNAPGGGQLPAAPTADMRNREAARGIASKSVEAIKALSTKIITKIGPAQRADALRRGVEAVLGNDPDFRAYQDARMALAGNLAVMQQGSRPSDADIRAIWLPMVPDAFRDTEQSAAIKWNLINTMSGFETAQGQAAPAPSSGGPSYQDYLNRRNRQ